MLTDLRFFFDRRYDVNGDGRIDKKEYLLTFYFNFYIFAAISPLVLPTPGLYAF
jgi:hypothetical protein